MTSQSGLDLEKRVVHSLGKDGCLLLDWELEGFQQGVVRGRAKLEVTTS